MIGTSFSPRCRAASSRPWPATISPSSDTITGAVQPYSTSDAAILATWSSEWVRAFLEYGFRRATGHCSICSGRKRSEVTGDVLEGERRKAGSMAGCRLWILAGFRSPPGSQGGGTANALIYEVIVEE